MSVLSNRNFRRGQPFLPAKGMNEIQRVGKLLRKGMEIAGVDGSAEMDMTGGRINIDALPRLYRVIVESGVSSSSSGTADAHKINVQALDVVADTTYGPTLSVWAPVDP